MANPDLQAELMLKQSLLHQLDECMQRIAILSIDRDQSRPYLMDVHAFKAVTGISLKDAIYDLLGRESSLTMHQIANRLNVPISSVRHAVQTMRRSGQLLASAKTGNSKYYELAK